jgi:hypothetical protein
MVGQPPILDIDSRHRYDNLLYLMEIMEEMRQRETASALEADKPACATLGR